MFCADYGFSDDRSGSKERLRVTEPPLPARLKTSGCFQKSPRAVRRAKWQKTVFLAVLQKSAERKIQKRIRLVVTHPRQMEGRRLDDVLEGKKAAEDDFP